MRALVTGAAGFVGSNLVDSLLERGDEVIGVDAFTPYYDRSTKESNLNAARTEARFRFEQLDLLTADLTSLLEGVDVVYHQAGQPGVRLSWSDRFEEYSKLNILATQRLLEAATAVRTPRLVYASSSSVYGQAARYPTHEDDLPQPTSPYGVTKLAAEHLCGLYAAAHGLSTVSLRYFTVFGPRQRPDMAIQRLLTAALLDEPFPLYGDGSSVRDFTFVNDVVRANLAAADADVAPGTMCNIAGGGEVSMVDLLVAVEGVLGATIKLDRQPPQLGDVPRTGGNTERAHELLGWEPEVHLDLGLKLQADWLQATLAAQPREMCVDRSHSERNPRISSGL